MTGIQELQDDILGLEAQLAGRRMELAMAQGERETARHHLHDMTQAIQSRMAFRVATADAQGQCFFNAQGSADRLAMRALA